MPDFRGTTIDIMSAAEICLFEEAIHVQVDFCTLSPRELSAIEFYFHMCLNSTNFYGIFIQVGNALGEFVIFFLHINH